MLARIPKETVAERKDYFAKVKHSLEPIQDEAVWEGILIKESQWAYADQGSYKMALRMVYKKHDDFLKQAKELQQLVEEKYCDEVLFKRFCSFFYNEEEQAKLKEEIDSLLEDLL